MAIVLIAFAVANRQVVTVSFDPFDTVDPAFSLALPLFVLILALVIVGVIVGGVAAWLRQGRWRGRARLAEGQARELRLENEQLKRRDGSVPARDADRRHSTMRRGFASRRRRRRGVARRSEPTRQDKPFTAR